MKANIEICKKCKIALDKYKRDKKDYYLNNWYSFINDEIEPFQSFEKWREIMNFVCGDCPYKLEHIVSDKVNFWTRLRNKLKDVFCG